jgi:hypothetical protein
MEPEGGDMFLPKRRLTFNGLHGVISQKMELFTHTAVRTSIVRSLELMLT